MRGTHYPRQADDLLESQENLAGTRLNGWQKGSFALSRPCETARSTTWPAT